MTGVSGQWSVTQRCRPTIRALRRLSPISPYMGLGVGGPGGGGKGFRPLPPPPGSLAARLRPAALVLPAKNVIFYYPEYRYKSYMPDQFHFVTSFTPAGDQPQAIRKLLAGVRAGIPHAVQTWATRRVAPAFLHNGIGGGGSGGRGKGHAPFAPSPRFICGKS